MKVTTQKRLFELSLLAERASQLEANIHATREQIAVVNQLHEAVLQQQRYFIPFRNQRERTFAKHCFALWCDCEDRMFNYLMALEEQKLNEPR